MVAGIEEEPVDSNASTLIVIAITAVGAIAWMAGLQVMARATRDRRARAEEAAARFDIEDETAGATVVGEAEVQGTPEDLSAKLAGLLARDGMGPLGPAKILACDRSELIFEVRGASAGGPGGVHRGRFRFTSTGSRTRVEYSIEAPSGRILIGMGWLCLLLSFAALVGGCWAMFTYVLPSPNPNVRGQAVQMVQVIHLL
jgi:hypothetical protein